MLWAVRPVRGEEIWRECGRNRWKVLSWDWFGAVLTFKLQRTHSSDEWIDAFWIVDKKSSFSFRKWKVWWFSRPCYWLFWGSIIVMTATKFVCGKITWRGTWSKFIIKNFHCLQGNQSMKPGWSKYLIENQKRCFIVQNVGKSLQERII